MPLPASFGTPAPQPGVYTGSKLLRPVLYLSFDPLNVGGPEKVQAAYGMRVQEVRTLEDAAHYLSFHNFTALVHDPASYFGTRFERHTEAFRHFMNIMKSDGSPVILFSVRGEETLARRWDLKRDIHYDAFVHQLGIGPEYGFAGIRNTLETLLPPEAFDPVLVKKPADPSAPAPKS